MEEKIENIVMEDGRMAERRTQRIEEKNGEIKYVTEFYVEKPREKHLAKRVVEVEGPGIEGLSRNDGNDAIDDAIDEQSAGGDSPVTREELQEAILSAVKAMQPHDSCGKVSAMQTIVADRVEPKKINSTNLLLWGIIVAQITALAYIVFMM
jgi:hypothetical protein